MLRLRYLSLSDVSIQFASSLLCIALPAEVDQRRTEMIKLQAELRVKMADMEERLLTELSESKGNILEDTKLLATLEDTRLHIKAV